LLIVGLEHFGSAAISSLSAKPIIDRSYLDEGVRLIELAKNASWLFSKQQPYEQRRLLNFVLSNSTWQNGELHPTFRQPFGLIALDCRNEARMGRKKPNSV
jgi:GrpB-like predicted nucleotidyltransferase (UPF0157 family)